MRTGRSVGPTGWRVVVSGAAWVGAAVFRATGSEAGAACLGRAGVVGAGVVGAGGAEAPAGAGRVEVAVRPAAGAVAERAVAGVGLADAVLPGVAVADAAPSRPVRPGREAGAGVAVTGMVAGAVGRAPGGGALRWVWAGATAADGPAGTVAEAAGSPGPRGPVASVVSTTSMAVPESLPAPVYARPGRDADSGAGRHLDSPSGAAMGRVTLPRVTRASNADRTDRALGRVE
ncbi:hypothetical protein [Jatrophihabitans sp.]|uniref:hypothetical protein n=1 Tax=Jatrophihabitans sp. TaxID=1932789 RepID=UPI002B5F8356|nr:hypothetical protein [Jatrophihabitans sp.]